MTLVNTCSILNTVMTHGPVLCEQESWGIHFEDGNRQDVWDVSSITKN